MMKNIKIILIVLLSFVSFVSFGQRRTNTDYLDVKEKAVMGTGTKTDAAILDIISTTKGAILPRMTETQRDNLPDVAGLIIYNTTVSRYQYNGGTGWLDFGSGVTEFIKVDSTNDIAGMTAPLGSIIFNYENGAKYKVQADTITGYVTDSIAVHPVTGGYAVLQTDLGIDVKWFGALNNVPFTNINNPIISGYTPSVSLSSDIAIYKAIQFAATFKLSSGTANKRVLFEGHFLAMDSSFTVPNGVEIWMVGNSYVHTNHNLPAFIINSHYGTSHRIKVTHKFFIGTTTGGMDWFPVSPATTEEDSTSVGVRVLNSRRCSFYDISAMNFNKGIDVSGESTACVENSFTISDIRNCKWGIYLDGNGGGWAHQNAFSGGRIKCDGTTNRNRAIDIECGAIYTNGDNCTFTAINMEGSTHYKYAVYTNASSNKFINCRFEAVMAGQIYFTTNARGNEINGSYGFINSTPWAKIPLFYSSDGVTYVQDSNLDDVYGRVIISDVLGYTINSGGSMDLTGGINGVADDGSGENVTLRLSMGQVGSEAAKYIETKMGRNDYSKTGFEINGSNELKYWGSSVTSGSGKELKKEWEERGYTTTDKTYNIGEWYQRGDFVDVSGTSYLVAKSFKAVDSATEISSNILVANTGRRDPLVEFDKDGAWVEYFTRKQKDGNAYYDLPAFLYGFAITMTTDNIEAVTSGTTLTAFPAGKAGINIKNTSGSGDVTVQLGSTNDYESGHIFYIACEKNSTSDIVITANSDVYTLDGLSYTLKPYEFSLYIMFNQSGTRRYFEIARNRLNVSGTTASRPTLAANDVGREYWDTDLDREIYWDGSAWVIPGEFSDCTITGTIWLNSGETLGIFTGTGIPEAAVTAAIGSTYHRTDGGAGTSFYVKESGAGNTGWVAK